MNHLMTQKQMRARGLAKIALKLAGCKINMADGDSDGGGTGSSGEEAKSDAGEQQQEQLQAQGSAQQDAINDSTALGTDAKAVIDDPAAGEQGQQT